jgi:predicted metal-dependent hydrolase
MLSGLFKLFSTPFASVYTTLKSGTTISVLGFERQIIFVKDIKRKVEISEQQIIVFNYRQDFSKVLEAGLRDYAYQIYYNFCQDLTQQLGVSFNKITMRDTRSRWGSCSGKGNLSFSWRLIFAPRAVAFYLAAHEVSHLKHMNHSRKFWDTVVKLDPHYQESRQWLRQHGHSLLRIRF